MENPSQSPQIPYQWRDMATMALVRMLRSKHYQLEHLSKERKILLDRINLQNQFWSQDVPSFGGQIVDSEMKYKQLKLEKSLQAAKFNLILGMKENDALLAKMKLESVQEDLEDMRSYAEVQAKQANNGNSDSSGELRKLKHDYEKLVCRNNTEVSALLSERDFVWNQLKRMEDEYINLLRIKKKDVEDAQLEVGKLQEEVKKLHAERSDKDIALTNLKVEIQCRDQEIARLSDELAQLSNGLKCKRSSRSNWVVSFDDRSLIAQEDEIGGLEKSSSKQLGTIKDSNGYTDEQPNELLGKLKEMTNQMEIKNIENENLRMLCSDLQHQLKKLKPQTKGGCGPKEDVSRNLIDELKTASVKEADKGSPSKETANGHELLNYPSVGSETPLKNEETSEALKGGHSSRRKRVKKDLKSRPPILFASAFKVPKLKGSHSAFE